MLRPVAEVSEEIQKTHHNNRINNMVIPEEEMLRAKGISHKWHRADDELLVCVVVLWADTCNLLHVGEYKRLRVIISCCGWPFESRYDDEAEDTMVVVGQNLVVSRLLWVR